MFSKLLPRKYVGGLNLSCQGLKIIQIKYLCNLSYLVTCDDDVINMYHQNYQITILSFDKKIIVRWTSFESLLSQIVVNFWCTMSGELASTYKILYLICTLDVPSLKLEILLVGTCIFLSLAHYWDRHYSQSIWCSFQWKYVAKVRSKWSIPIFVVGANAFS